MTVRDDLERRIADHYLVDAPTRAPDRVLESTLAAIDRTPQRRFDAAQRRLGAAGRAFGWPLDWRLAAAAVVGLTFLVAGATFLATEDGGVGGSPTATATPRPTDAAVASLTSLIDGRPGTYVIERPFAVPGIALTLGEGWELDQVGGGLVALHLRPSADRPGVAQGGLSIEAPQPLVVTVYPDTVDPAWRMAHPCEAVPNEPGGIEPGHRPGPDLAGGGRQVDSAAELAAALAESYRFEPGAVTETTLSGLPAVTVDARVIVDCDWAAEVGPGNPFIPLAERSATRKDTVHRTVVADVDGRRYIVTALIFPWTTQAERDEIDRALRSIRIPTD